MEEADFVNTLDDLRKHLFKFILEFNSKTDKFYGDAESAKDELVKFDGIPRSGPDDYGKFMEALSYNAKSYYLWCNYHQIDFHTGEFWGYGNEETEGNEQNQ